MAMGRPKGSKNRPQFHTYTDERDRKAFVEWVKESYRDKPELAKWYGEQMFGKAPQALELSNPDGSLKTIVVEKANGDSKDKTTT